MIRLWGPLALAAVASCGRLRFDGRPEAGDAAASDAVAADAPRGDAPGDGAQALIDPCDVAAADRYVLAGATGDGSSPATPAGSIAGVVTNSTGPIVVHVAAGTYQEKLAITRDVVLCGGWDATFTVRAPRTQQTWITTGTDATISIANATSATLVDGFHLDNTASSGGSSVGIVVQSGDPTIARDWIHSGPDPGGSRAVLVYAGAPVIRDCDLLAADTGGGSWGFDCIGAADPMVANDTIAGRTTGIRLLQGCTPRLANDLLIDFASGVWEADTSSAPRSIESVGFVPNGGANLILEPASSITSSSGVDALQGSSVPGGGTMRSAHASIATASPSNLFASFAGPDGNLDTMGDNDWRLAAGGGLADGKDTSGGDCGTNESPESCGDVRDDIDGKPRAVPYTIGSSQR